MTNLFTAENAIAFVSLAAMELVLGIDNLVFIAILVGKLPEAQRKPAQRLGLVAALVMRIGLLFAIKWVMGLTAPLFAILGNEISGRDLILLVGGLFLIGKSTHEIYDKLEGDDAEGDGAKGKGAFWIVFAQIIVLDLVFSLDSVITAVGMVDEVAIMIAAMVVAVAGMIAFASSVGAFVQKHPSVKILALSFLILIGVMLVAEGLGQHVSKGTIYAAMGFALLVELLNMRFRRKQKPVALHGPTSVKPEP